MVTAKHLDGCLSRPAAQLVPMTVKLLRASARAARCFTHAWKTLSSGAMPSHAIATSSPSQTTKHSLARRPLRISNGQLASMLQLHPLLLEQPLLLRVYRIFSSYRSRFKQIASPRL